MSTWSLNPSERDSYRERHGSDSLLLHSGRGGIFLCKHHDASGATLVKLGTHAELTVTVDEYKAEFRVCWMDEATLYFGPPDVRASAERQVAAQMAAEKFCIEQERSMRGLVN